MHLVNLYNEILLHITDALQDFDKSNSGAKPEKTAGTTDGTGNATSEVNEDPDAFFMWVVRIGLSLLSNPFGLWSCSEQAKVLADRMNTLFGGPDTPSGDIPPMPQDPEQIMAGFKKMAEAAALTLSGENTANDDEVSKYSDSISQALKVRSLTRMISNHSIINPLYLLKGSSRGHRKSCCTRVREWHCQHVWILESRGKVMWNYFYYLITYIQYILGRRKW